MMALKRKPNPYVHDSTDILGRKRSKRSYTVISSSESGTDDGSAENSDIGEDEWLIKCILDENESQYLIDWDGPWSPTWEPKENANDVAVQVWDEKKKIGSTQEVQQSTKDVRPQQYSPTPTEAAGRSFQPESRLIEPDCPAAKKLGKLHCPSNSGAAPLAPADLEEALESSNGEPRFFLNSQLSPFFVTPEPGARLQSRKNDGETLEEIPETLLKDSKPPASLRAIDCDGWQCGQVVFKLNEAHSTSPFEYISLSPIPPEYQLPGETNALESSAYTAALKQRGSTASGTTDEIKYHDSLEFQDGSSRESSQKAKEVDEIAETPSVCLNDAESKTSFCEPDTEDVSVSSSYFASASGKDSFSPAKSAAFAENPRSFGPAPATVELSNSVQKTVQPGESQTPEVPDSQLQDREQASTQPAYPIQRVLQDKMDKESLKKPLSHAELMEKYSHIPGATMAEKMNNAQAEIREKSIEPFNLLRASAKPSEPPARAASAGLAHPQSDEVDKGHVRHSTLPPISGSVLHQPEVPYPKHEEDTVQTIQPSALTVNYTQPSRGSVQLGPSEYAITLPMDSRLKDDYEQALGRDIRSIREFIDMGSADSTGTTLDDLYPQLESKMNGILEQLGNITTHPDLNMLEHIRESQSNLEQEAFWGEYSSSKFLLLSYLLRVASGHDLHFVVMVQGSKLLDILERFLLGKGLVYTRPRQEMGPGTDLEVSMVKHSLSFGIQTTRSDGIIQTFRPPSAIIALDRSFNAQTPSVEHMRTTYARNGHLLPVIRLLVSNTSEHIERCLADASPQQRLRLLMHHTTELADVVGELQDNALNVQEDAEEILSCLTSDNFDANWSLPPIEPLQILEPEELDTFLREHQRNVSLAQPTARKRSVQPEEDTIEQTLKRPRTDPMAADIHAGRSNLPSQTPDTGLEASEVKSENLVELDTLRKALADSELLLTQRIKIHEELQHRYESRTKDLHKIRRDRDSLATAKLSLVERVERLREENAKLKEERTELKRDLRQARETILSGSGSAAELETANEEIRRLRAENTSLERKADYEKNQNEYTREQYQTASTVAAQSGNEIRQLKAENEMLKRKVAGEASRLREVNLKSDQDRNLSRVMELELTLANRDDLLRRKEEELREIRKNRPSTRSTSTQPRSPKISSANSRPSSPGLNNNHNGSNPLGRGSSALRFSSEAR